MVKRYKNNASIERSDGQIAFTPQGRAIADKRQSTSSGRIHRVLGKGGPFSQEFKDTILGDHMWILERPHLETELKAAKRTLQALEGVKNDSDSQRLLRKMYKDPHTRKGECLLCPVWRHEHQLRIADMATQRYLFDTVRGELFLVTIIFGFAENLDELEEALSSAHDILKSATSMMSKKRRGLFMVGSFEPDLEGPDDLVNKPSRARMMMDFGKSVPPSGGWVLTGHFLARIPNDEDYEAILDSLLPASGWDRVRLDRISRNKKLIGQLLSVLGYAAKPPRPLFETPAQPKKRRHADKHIGGLEAAFVGPSYDIDSLKHSPFDVDAAIRQWAKFMNRVGSKKIYYSVESVHAQKWYSQSEMDYIWSTGWGHDSRGQFRIEVHRDTGPYSRSELLPRLKGKCRRLQSRRLQFDPEWVRMTDCSDIDPSTQVPMFEDWIRSRRKIGTIS